MTMSRISLCFDVEGSRSSSQLLFLDKNFVIKKWHWLGLFVTHWALALVIISAAYLCTVACLVGLLLWYGYFQLACVCLACRPFN